MSEENKGKSWSEIMDAISRKGQARVAKARKKWEKAAKLRQDRDATNLVSSDPISSLWTDYLIRIPAGETKITLSAEAPITIKIVLPKEEERCHY